MSDFTADDIVDYWTGTPWEGTGKVAEAEMAPYQSSSTFDREQWKEKKKQEREETFALADETLKEISGDSFLFQVYLNVQARMDAYSVVNTLLILKQRANATKLKDFKGWKECGAQIGKGEKSFAILEPARYQKEDGSTGTTYHVKRVFDITQTNMKAEEEPESLNPRKVLTALLKASHAGSETVAEMEGEHCCRYDPDRKIIRILSGAGDFERLFQELSLASAQAMAAEKGVEGREGFAAKCCAYMLCRKYGVKETVHIVDNLPEAWKTMSTKEIRGEIAGIRTLFKEIHDSMYQELHKDERSREKDQTRERHDRRTSYER